MTIELRYTPCKRRSNIPQCCAINRVLAISLAIYELTNFGVGCMWLNVKLEKKNSFFFTDFSINYILN